MRLLTALFLAVCVFGSGCNDGSCELGGYTPQSVALVSGEPAVVMSGNECVVYTNLPVDTTNPDQYGAQLRHIGKSIYACLNGTAPTGAEPVDLPFYRETLWFRIDGQCPARNDGKFYYGCWEAAGSGCRTVDMNLAHIGPQPECIGVAMGQWGETCWAQFYGVLGHEVMHGWLGSFHK